MEAGLQESVQQKVGMETGKQTFRLVTVAAAADSDRGVIIEEPHRSWGSASLRVLSSLFAV